MADNNNINIAQLDSINFDGLTLESLIELNDQNNDNINTCNITSNSAIMSSDIIKSNDNNNSIYQVATIEDVLTSNNDVQMQDFAAVFKQSLKDFDKNAWAAKKGYETPSFPIWSQKMEGLGTGFYIVAGYSNSGKTAFMTNLAYNYAKHEDNKLYLVYYSLDDTKQRIIPRFIAMNKKIPITICEKPARYEELIQSNHPNKDELNNALLKRKEGLQELIDMSSNLYIADAEEITSIEKLANHARMVQTYVKAIDSDSNIIICIDSLMDLSFSEKTYKDEVSKNSAISSYIKNLANNELKCPIFASAHMRKNTGTKRPTISDLKESGRYEYDASAVFVVSNDVSRNGQNADIYYRRPNAGEEKFPILEVQWAKNKVSSFKERLYYIFTPENSSITECTQEQMKQFDKKIYNL